MGRTTAAGRSYLAQSSVTARSQALSVVVAATFLIAYLIPTAAFPGTRRGTTSRACAGVGHCAAGVAQDSYTINVAEPGTDTGTVSRVGPWSMRDPTLARARQVFGFVSLMREVRPGFAGTTVADCELTWAPLGLKVLFTTLGLAPGSCNPMKLASTATIKSRRWKTWRGLRVGDPTSRIRALEPHATIHRGVWWLASYYTPIGSGGTGPSVIAISQAGRIFAFRLYIGAQGE